MGQRSRRHPRCARCAMHVEHCVCAAIPRLATRCRVEIVMHRRERTKTTATAPLALAALPAATLHVHGIQDAPLDLSGLHDDGRRVLVLFPGEGARVLDAAFLAEDPRPVTLVVPDGSWRQAARAARRIPGLDRATQVVLAEDGPTRWGLREETRTGGLATLEAIARALGVLEGPHHRTALEQLLDLVVARTHATRQVPAGTRPHA